MWALKNGAILFNVHPATVCGGTPCWIHNPSPHHMTDWPMARLADGRIERECSHGLYHPDPDDLWFWTNIEHLENAGLHPCDGCCVNGERATDE